MTHYPPGCENAYSLVRVSMHVKLVAENLCGHLSKHSGRRQSAILALDGAGVFNLKVWRILHQTY